MLSLQTTRLPSRERPRVVDDWLKNPTEIHKVISDPTNYGESWKMWWTECQPPARAEETWPFSRESHLNLQWGKLLNGGKYGIFSLLVGLSWWAVSLDPNTSAPDLAEAITDLDWAICQLIASLTASPKSPPPTPTPEVQDPSISKRKVKLTQKAMGGGDRVQKRFRRS